MVVVVLNGLNSKTTTARHSAAACQTININVLKEANWYQLEAFQQMYYTIQPHIIILYFSISDKLKKQDSL